MRNDKASLQSLNVTWNLVQCILDVWSTILSHVVILTYLDGARREDPGPLLPKQHHVAEVARAARQQQRLANLHPEHLALRQQLRLRHGATTPAPTVQGLRVLVRALGVT